MACGCKAKSAGQPTAIKQVAKNRNLAATKSVKTPQQQRAAKENVVRRVVRRPFF